LFKQGLESHSLMSISHLRPLNPGPHSHIKLLIPSIHVPPLKQESLEQSSMFKEQFGPKNPLAQEQL